MMFLLGSWISDPEYPEQEKVQIDFAENKHLVYTRITEDKEEIILLTYRIENGFLITDQPF